MGPRLASVRHAKLRGKAAGAWDLGTRDAGGFGSFSAIVDYLCWLGGRFACSGDADDRRSLVEAAMRAIEAHEMALTDRMLNGTPDLPGLLRLKRVKLLGDPTVNDQREGVCSFTIDGLSAGEVVERCEQAGVIVHDRQSDAYSRQTLEALGASECVRASLGHYNTPGEVDAFLGVVGEVCAKVRR